VKVAHNTPARLMLDARPVALAAGIGALLLILLGLGLHRMTQARWGDALGLIVFGGAMGVAALWAFVRRERVWFDRADATVTFAVTTLFGTTTARLPLPDDATARVQTRESRDRRTGRDRMITLYRPALVLQDGTEMALSEVWTAHRDGADAAVQTVTQWLAAR